MLGSVRRRWTTAVAVLALVLTAAALLIATTPRSYVSTATVGIVPGRTNVSIDSFGQLANVAPLYAELARSTDVRARVRTLVGGDVGATTVRTFRDTPLILKLDATATSPETAEATAAAFVTALQDEARTGAVAPASQVSIRVFGAPGLPSAPTSPQVSVILFAAVVIGLLLAVAAAVIRDAPTVAQSSKRRR